MIHKFIDKMILKILKREMNQYEIEKVKIGVFGLPSLLVLIFSIVSSLISGEKIGILTLLMGASAMFLPLTLLYALPFMIGIIKSSLKLGSEGIFTSALFGANFFVGFVMSILLIFLGFFLAIIIGFPVSVYVIYNKLSSIKAQA